jgi:hypothetical protein
VWEFGVWKPCLMVPEIGSEVPTHAAHGGGCGTIGTVEFELHVLNYLGTICLVGPLGFVGVGCGSCLMVPEGGSPSPNPPHSGGGGQLER